jgi:hypothetical protein
VASLLVNEQHRSVDLGLMQINAANLQKLGLTVADAFDPCQSLAAAGRLLQGGYLTAGGGYVPSQTALRKALSLYNTGTLTRGFVNGYVKRVEAAASQVQAELSNGVWRIPVTQIDLPPPRFPPDGWPQNPNEPTASRPTSPEPFVLRVAYAPQSISRLYTDPTLVTQIIFAAGERILGMSIGAPSQWITSTAGNLLFIKPTGLGPQTDMIIATLREDGVRHDYRFLLETHDAQASSPARSERRMPGYDQVVLNYPQIPVETVKLSDVAPHPTAHVVHIAHLRTAVHTHHTASKNLRAHRSTSMKEVFACLRNANCHHSS